MNEQQQTLENKTNTVQAAANTVGKEGKVLSDNRLIQKKANNTGLPDNLKSGIENLSGHAMDDVKVHYNSDKPAQLNAHAYAQGNDIHVASGQEKHLSHEAWHVVQQKQGRVKPTMQMKGKVNVNDDAGLEKEADVMGTKALLTNEKAAIQRKRKNKKANWNQKQKDQNKRLFERREIRQVGYAADRQREHERELDFIQSWLPEIEKKKKELLENKEVKRAKSGKNLNEDIWTEAVDELVDNLKNLHSSNSSATRGKLRAKMESAWTTRQVGRQGEESAISTMPPKIWYTTQEIFDAKTVFLNNRFALIPGGEGHKDVEAGKKPDYFTENGVGDAQNVDTSNIHDTIEQSMGTVTSKVAKYPDAKVTVTIGVHNCPEILDPVNIAILKGRINHLVKKPSRVYLVCGSKSKLAYP
ncbi:eCIS core domain-containing protein [Flavobacterium sp.]|uniref:eCIS core domain-containing protein n=1 Tax=Flavobacterium sp. TaxID=239 RepID=UPI0040473661